MSSIAYGALTRKRQEAPANTSTLDEPPGLKTYVDTLAALVPAEVLAAHAAFMTIATSTAGGKTALTHPGTLKVAFWAPLGLSFVFYVVGYQCLLTATAGSPARPRGPPGTSSSAGRRRRPYPWPRRRRRCTPASRSRSGPGCPA